MNDTSQPPKTDAVPVSDFYEVTETLNPEELALLKQVRAFMKDKVAPVITKYWAEDAFPFELLPEFRELGIGGLGMQGYGCRGGSIRLFGFAQMEMARVDPSFATFFPKRAAAFPRGRITVTFVVQRHRNVQATTALTGAHQQFFTLALFDFLGHARRFRDHPLEFFHLIA